MPCPFLTRLYSSVGAPKNYGVVTVKLLGSQCPMKGRCLSDARQEEEDVTELRTKCPFLSKITNVVKEVKGVETFDIAPADSSIFANDKVSFNYDNFFDDKILKKKNDHTYRIFKKVNRLSADFPNALEYTEHEKLITVWCANDYLGISSHPAVKLAARDAIEKFGTGAGGTRNISGNSLFHEQLENELAKLHQKEAALLFTSCFVANDSALYTLGKMLPGCVLLSDELNHASMIHGIRNSRATKYIFSHNNCEHLEYLLQNLDPALPKIVAFETVHSMSGTISSLEKLCDIAHKYDALTFVDEVHAVGLFGFHGAGIAERDNVLHKIDIISGTLGKTMGNIGGYVAGKRNVIDVIRSYAAGHIFTTSLPPSVLAASLKALEILSSNEGRMLRQKHQENVHAMRNMLLTHGLPVENSAYRSHIIPIRIGDPKKNTELCNILLKECGQYIQAINYPTVPKGEEKLRLAPTPFHSHAMMCKLLHDLKQVYSRLKLPLQQQSPCAINC